MSDDSIRKNSVAVPEQSVAGFDTGAFLPRDMTVRLVRAESAGWEIFLSVFWSITLTIFGIFLGAWISASNQKPIPLTVSTATGENLAHKEIIVDLAQATFGTFNKVACILFGLISLVLLGAWGYIKIRQSSSSLKVPYELFQRFTERGTED